MKKLTITVGISGSGKSTWAHNQWKENPKNTIIVNRDKIRELLYGYNESNIKDYYLHPNIHSFEKEVTKYENVLIKEGLASRKHVIVDATHLEAKYIKRFKYFNLPINIHIFTVDAKTCLERNKSRTRSVDNNIILKQAQKMAKLGTQIIDLSKEIQPVSLEQDNKLPKCIILDLDGTIAIKNNRSAYDYEKVDQDIVEPNLHEILIAINYHNDLLSANSPEGKINIIICTGREAVGECEVKSKKWCETHEIGFTEFHMRKEGDMRADWIVKEEMWRDISTRYNIIGMFDDRNQVTDRARNLGLTVFHVAYHNF